MPLDLAILCFMTLSPTDKKRLVCKDRDIIIYCIIVDSSQKGYNSSSCTLCFPSILSPLSLFFPPFFQLYILK